MCLSEGTCFPFLPRSPIPAVGTDGGTPFPPSSPWSAVPSWRRQSYAAIGQWGQDQDIALMHQLGFTRTPPKAGGIRKVLIALDVIAFEAVLTRWAEANLSPPVPPTSAPPEAFALDGKSVRGSFDGCEHAVHLLSLMAHNSGLTLHAGGRAPRRRGQDPRAQNRSPAARGGRPEGSRGHRRRPLLPADLSQQVIDAQGHFLWFVKENQPTLLQDLEAAFAPSVEGAFSPSAAAVLGAGDGDRDDAR